MDTATRRLNKELLAYSKDPNPCLSSLGPSSDDSLFHWTAVLKGPPSSPYSHGQWTIQITIPSNNYPLHPPTFKFVTPICHPNIHPVTGEVCLDVLKSQWSPAWTVSAACTAVQAMLSDPEPDSPLNIDAANLARLEMKKKEWLRKKEKEGEEAEEGDGLANPALVRYWTKRYASGKSKE